MAAASTVGTCARCGGDTFVSDTGEILHDASGVDHAVVVETPVCPRCRRTIPLTLDDNSGEMRYRCETCDVEQCGHCGPARLVAYSDAAPNGWYHLDADVECFLHGPLTAETIAALEATR